MTDTKVIGVIDADSFEVGIYQKLPEYQSTIGLPCVVSIGPNCERIVSVSPEAKLKGISRSMTVSQAMQKFPDLVIIPKSSEFNKPESKRLRTASYELRNSILEFFNYHAPESCLEGDDCVSNVTMEISGNDEFFLDLSRPVETLMETFDEHELDTNRKVIVECSQGQYYGTRLNYIKRHAFMAPEDFEEELPALAHAAGIMQLLCEFVKDKIGYTCSAGVGTNKIAAKIACKLHKPAGVVLLTPGGIPRVSQNFNYRDIPGLGGSLGDRVSNIFGDQMTMSQLNRICTPGHSQREFEQLQNEFTKDEIDKINLLSQGICLSKVEQRIMNRNVSSGKNNLYLNGPQRYIKLRNVMCDLADEIADRIQEESDWNRRNACRLKFTFQYAVNGKPQDVNFTLNQFRFGASPEEIFEEAWAHFRAHNEEFGYNIACITSIKFTIVEFDIIEDVAGLIKNRMYSERSRFWHMKRLKGPPSSALELEDLLTGYELHN